MALNPVADQFPVNQIRNPEAGLAAVASNGSGTFVVVWHSEDADGLGIFGRRYRPDGTPVGGEFRVNTTTEGNQELPDVGMAENGSFVVVWSGRGSDNGQFDSDIYAQRYSPTGVPVGGEFRVNTTTDGRQYSAAIAVADNGNFTIAWDSSPSFNDSDIYARSFSSTNAAGAPLGQDFLVNQFTDDFQVQPAIATDNVGNVAISWTSGDFFGGNDGPDGDSTAVAARLFTAGGSARGNEFVVNQTTVGNQEGPAIAMTPSGNFVITYTDNPGSAPYRLLGRQYTPNGTPSGSEIVIDSSNSGSQNSEVAIDDAGSFAVTWSANETPGDLDFDIYARRFRANGTPDTNRFQVNTVDSIYEVGADIASDADGDVVIVWSTLSTDTIDARQYSPRSTRGGGGNQGGSGGNQGGGPLVGTASANVLRGTAAADVIRGLGGDDRLLGRGNDDQLIGGAGDDFLNGGGGNDNMRGGGGDDTLIGGGGNDFLDGGSGDNVLKGGGGSDTFVLRKGNGVNRIQDFKRQDTFELKGMRARDLTIERMGNGVLISRGNDEIAFVQGVNPNQLPTDIFGASNFV